MTVNMSPSVASRPMALYQKISQLEMFSSVFHEEDLLKDAGIVFSHCKLHELASIKIFCVELLC